MTTISGSYGPITSSNKTYVAAEMFTVPASGTYTFVHTITDHNETTTTASFFGISISNPQNTVNRVLSQGLTLEHTQVLPEGAVVEFFIQMMNATVSGTWSVTSDALLPPLPSNAFTPDDISGIYVGSESAEALYHGSALLWQHMQTVKITGTTYQQARNQFRQALVDHGTTFNTVKKLPFLLDTSECTDMSEMFHGCVNLTEIPPMDTSNVTNLYQTFRLCASLTYIGDLHTANVINANHTFRDCASLGDYGVRLIGRNVEVSTGAYMITGSNLTREPWFGENESPWVPVVLDTISSAATGRVRVAFAGSSTTQGYGTPRNESYAHVFTARMVRAVPGANASAMVSQTSGTSGPSSSESGFHFLNVGLGGTNAATYLNSARTSLLYGWGPNLIIHMVGSNDYAEQRSIATYKTNLRSVVNALPNSRHVFVHTYRRTDRADTGITWAQYGQAASDIANEFTNARFVDVSQMYESRKKPGVSYMMADNIHATWEGNELLAHCVADALELPTNAEQTVWAAKANDSRSSNGTIVPTDDSSVQITATSPSAATRVDIITDSGSPVFTFNNSNARYADTPSWNQAVAFPLAFFVVINSWGSASRETTIAPWFSRSVMGDDGWWWAWKGSFSFDYFAALNSAFSHPANSETSALPRIVGIHMSANNRAHTYVNAKTPLVAGPDRIDVNLGPWMKSLRLGANSGANNYTSNLIREFRFETAPVEPQEFMARRMTELASQYGAPLAN